MPKGFLQVEHRPAMPEIVHRECVPESMDAALHRSKPKPAAECLKIPQHIPPLQLASVSGAEEQVNISILLGRVFPKHFPQFKRERHNPVLSAFTVNREQHLVKIHAG